MQPTTLEEAIDYVRPWFEEDRNEWIELSADEFLSACHFSVGMKIRNELHLWDQESALYQHFQTISPGSHPDGMSAVILAGVMKN